MRPPSPWLALPGPEPPGRPPAAVGGRRQGTRGTPPLPPPSTWADGGRPERRRPRTPPGGPLHPGRGHHSRGKRSRAPSAPSRPPAHSRIARCRPATERQYPAMRKRSGRHWCQPGESGGADRTEDTSSPLPPATLTHPRPTGPRWAPTTARQPRLHMYTPGGCVGDKG